MQLTKKQTAFYDFILSYTRENGFAPTQKEIKEFFNFKSFGSVQRYLKYLVDANLIELDWNARRGIKLIGQKKQELDPSQFEEVPLLGDVAAGIPIEAIENPSQSITIPAHMIRSSSKHFALKVKGDSMIEDGIFEEDLIIVKHQATANQGQTVVAVVDGEATVKRYKKHQNKIELIPANSSMDSIWVNPEQNFQIAGVLVGLIRNYI